MKMLNTTQRLAIVLSCTFVMGLTIFVTYPHAEELLESYTISYYRYTPSQKVLSTKVDLSNAEPAIAVPILMYHGVTHEQDNDNTNINRFIEHMEMLKVEGYETITLQQFEEFLKDKYTLPPRPIIITFDDGRKDSYFTTDDIFRKLEFKATIFMVSGKANDRDKFYLGWHDLKTMSTSGRWDIQAHGTYSHDKILIDEFGNTGRFLTSLQYIDQRLETVPEYETRVEKDYIQNIEDFDAHLGYKPKYYAIPINEYGENIVSNYPQAGVFNTQLMKKYFSLAFIEGYVYQPGDEYSRVYNKPIYNFQDVNPYRVSRIEPKNMDAENLKKLLESNAPHTLPYTISFNDIDKMKTDAILAYGNMDIQENGLHLISVPGEESAKVLFGDENWSNYTVTAEFTWVSGRSIVLLGYANDDKNYFAFGITDGGVFIRETVHGIEQDLRPPFLGYVSLPKDTTLKLVFDNNKVNAYIDDRAMYTGITTSFTTGEVGFKTWDDKGNGEGILHSLTVTETK